MTKPANRESIEKGTKKTWEEWVDFIDNAGGHDLEHAEIAKRVYEKLDGKIDSAGWWAQGVTVAYEQHIGRRKPGQRSDGTFEISVNKNLDGSREDIFTKVLDWVNGVSEFNGQSFTNPRESITPVRSYWRCDVADGSKLGVAVGPRSGGNFMVTVSHTKLQDKDQADDWRSYWKQVIGRL